MKSDACPDRKTLQRLLLGDLPKSRCETLDEHLLECDECATQAETISASDEITEAIRTRRVFMGDEDVLARVIARGKMLRSEASTVQPDETLAVNRRERAGDSSSANIRAADSSETIDFLQPAEQPDEIGRLGGHRVLEVMGVGGMGVVFRAEDPKLERPIALKAMKPTVAASKSAKDRFLREAKATASIDHDHIVHIYQVGEDHNIPFIAMQFLHGESLQSRLQRDGRLDQLEVARIGREVATGLAAAHAQDLIHRDIKPDNIWIEEENGRAKILDFGLVRSVRDDAGLTQSGMVLGTPRYMSPEQAQGQEVDHRGDLFSLGSVLYHLASGKPPFKGGSLTATLIAVAHEEAESIQQTCPQLNAELGELIMSLLNKDAAQRPLSAVAVANALANIEKQIEDEQAKLAEKKKRQAVEETVTTAKPIPTRPQAIPSRVDRKTILIGGAIALFAVGALFALWSAGIIFRVDTNDGVLVVKVTGGDFAATVQGKTVTIQNTQTQAKVTIDLNKREQRRSLPPGEYKFLLTTDSGLKTRASRFTISRGRNQQVEVWWEAKSSGAGQPVAANQGDYALAFDGVDDYVEIPTLKYDGAHPVTIEAVVQASKLDSVVPVNFGKRIGLGLNRERASAVISLAGGELLTSQTKTPALDAGKTTHLAIVYDGRRPSIYVNGVRRATVSEWMGGKEGDFSLPIEPNRLAGAMLGCADPGVVKARYFAGRIDEVRISNYARYTSDFKPARQLGSDERTLALYHFDAGRGAILKDSSGNGHDGTIHGAKWVGADEEFEYAPGEVATTPAQTSEDDPGVITVAQDGSADCTTIAEALGQANAGATIRVVDNSIYQEALLLSNPTRHARVTLEATRGATVSLPAQANAAVMLRSVQGVTLRGFKLQLTKPGAACCVVTDAASELTLDNVTFLGGDSPFTYGVSVEGLASETQAPNVLIQNCLFEGLTLCVRVSGIANDYKTPMTCRRISIVESRFRNNAQAITLAGDVRDVLIAGNQISGAKETGVQLQNLVPGAQNIRILNNTMFDCTHSMALWDTEARGVNIRVLNNLTIQSGSPDWIFIDNGGSATQSKGPGDGPSVLQKWELACNWRETEVTSGQRRKGLDSG